MKKLGQIIIVIFLLSLLPPITFAQDSGNILDSVNALVGCTSGKKIQSIKFAANTKSVQNVLTTWPGAVWCFYDDGSVLVQRHNTVTMTGTYTVPKKNTIRVKVRYRSWNGGGGVWSNIDAIIKPRPNNKKKIIANITWEAGSMSAACVNNICYGNNQYRAAIFKQNF